MDRSKITPDTTNLQNFHIQVQDETFPSHQQLPIKVQESRTGQLDNTKVGGQFAQGLFRVLFLAHLILIAILVIFLTIRGLLPPYSQKFYAKKWYPPLLTATASAGIVAFTCQWITLCNPARAIKMAFWFSPLLTCALGVLLVLIGSAASLGLGVIAVVLAFILSLYACWVNPLLDYAIKILSVSTAFPPAKTAELVAITIAMSILYSTFLVSGIGGASASGKELDILFIFVILLSLAWSMQVFKNTLQVTISRIKFIHFAIGADFETRIATQDTVKYLMGSVCIGSALVPAITVVRSSARLITRIAGGTDEFLFSCASCYSGLASALVNYGNRWGFVQVGVYKKGFVQASTDTWELLRTAGLEPLIDQDLTGSFCFLCGMAGGAISALIGGIWTLVVHKSYAIEVAICAYLIGYFTCRVAMSWPMACVSAYYIAYAENPGNPRFDSTIPDRIQELQRYGA